MKRVIGKINPENLNITIWGAGFSGLVLGYYLKKNGCNVTIFEKSNRAGGKIQTKKSGPGLVEKGANALFLNEDVIELLKELKLEPLPAAKNLKRLLFIKGIPRRAFRFSFLASIIFNAHKRPPAINEGLTISDFFKPLVGEEKVKSIISPALGGLYATNADQLHFKSIFHQVGNRARLDSYWDFVRLLMKSRKPTSKNELSGSVSFEGGMQTLINALSEEMKSNIKYNHKESFKLKNNTIICTDAHTAAELLQDIKPEISTQLSLINYQEICSATVFLKKDIKSLQKSFGVLIPQEEGFNSIGILNNKAIFPKNNQGVSAYTFISPKELKEIELMEDLKRLNPDITIDDIEHMSFNYWNKGLPQYNLQRYLAIKRLHQLLSKDCGLALFGNYVAGISLREMVTAAKQFAENPNDYSSIEF